jgi:ABC-2 type transport system ATP-binding protein
MAAIEVDGLTKTYGETVANDDLSFTVESGEIFGYLGPNGAGKTTTIRTLMGFQSPTAGTATVLGADVRDADALRRARQRVGYLPAHPSFDADVTGDAFLDYQGALKGDERRGELLALFDPPLDRPIRAYSTGNAQMLAIVQAFMHDPDLVIMDEPTAGLDPLKQERFNEFLRAERDRGVTVFFSSHVLAEVQRVCDRVGIVRDGSLVALEDVDDLLERGGKRVRIQTAAPLSAGDLDLPGVVDVTLVGDSAQFTYAGEYDALVDLLDRFDLVDLTVEEPPLEDVFMHYYGDRDA